MNRKKLVLADDHAMLLDGLVRLLEDEFEVVAAVTDGRALVAETARLRPDAAVLDIGMPLLNGVEAARQIRECAPEIRIVVLTQQTAKDYVRAAIAAGASAYVVKSSAATELREALTQVFAGRQYISPSLSEQYGWQNLVGGADATWLGRELTARQREVLQLVAEGNTAKEIAQILGISVKTVEFHKSGIMDELGLRTTAELTRYAIEHGMLAGAARLEG